MSIFRRLLGIILICSFLTACTLNDDTSNFAQSGSDGKIHLRMGLSLSNKDARYDSIVAFASEINQSSDDIAIDIISGYQDQYDMMSDFKKNDGTLDFALIAAPYMSEGFDTPELMISGLCYVFDDYDMAFAFMDSDVNDKCNKKLEEKDIYTLTYFCGGFRCFANSIHPIRSPEDFEGLRVGTVKSKHLFDMFTTLGAYPSACISSEVRESAGKGIYTGNDNSLLTMDRDNIYEYLPYISITNHAYNMWGLYMNQNAVNKLSDEQLEIIQSAAVNTAINERILSKEKSENIINTFIEAGIEVNYTDYEPFREATEELRRDYARDFIEIYDEFLVWQNDYLAQNK